MKRDFIFLYLFGFILSSTRCFSAEGYYKDLFMDGGVGLTSRTTLPAADFLDLSWEFLASSDQALQDEFIIGTEEDTNGVLLYPDGAPRFQCIYVNGGGATMHGESLGETGRKRIVDFYYGGGCYTGSCAGAFLVTSGYNSYINPAYLHIWPALSKTTGLLDAYTGHFIPAASPLLNYYNFGDDLYIDNVRHNGGGYFIKDSSNYWVSGSEVLLLYDYPDRAMHENVSCLAYKVDDYSGRVVVIGSHPEGVSTGERRDLMAGILQYARDGAGLPRVKTSLQNSVPRYMNDNSSPGFEKIGDRQYHHFTLDIPAGCGSMTVSIDGEEGFDLDLYARHGGFAFRTEAGIIKAENTPAADESLVLHNPPEGLWYIGVKCYTKVVAEKTDWGWIYTDKQEVLNGVSYNITADWEPGSSTGNSWLFY